MKDAIFILLAERYFKKEDINDWAIKCLEEGFDSKSLRILASMSKWDSDSELDNYFQRSLKELDWNQIQKEDYLMKYAKILAKEIIEEKINPIKASHKIYQILVDLDYPAELYGWFEIDEMIWDYEHFVIPKGNWFAKKIDGLKCPTRFSLSNLSAVNKLKRVGQLKQIFRKPIPVGYKTGVKYYHYQPEEKLIDEIKRVAEELIKSEKKV